MSRDRSETGPLLRDGHCLLILFIVTVALFRKALFSGGVVLSHPIFLDLTHQFFPWRLYGFGLLNKGIIPLWNPYVFCGTPFIAHWHSAVFYPLNMIFLIAPVHIALNYSIAFHLFLSGALTYAFVRYLLKNSFSALVAALIFMLSGPQVAHLFPGHVFNPLPWFPLSLLLAERAVRSKRMIYFLLGGIVLAMQVLAGLPQYMLYCLAALLLYFLYRAVGECRNEGSLAPLGFIFRGVIVLLVIGFALSAVQLLPSWEFKDHSSRALLAGPKSVSEISLPPENLVTLIVPGFFGDMSGVRYWGRWLMWETCLYTGILSLFLALTGVLCVRNRYTIFFAALAVLATILAFGAYSPLFPLLYRFVPGFNLFRGQAKFAFLTAFSLSVLAGYGCRFITGSHIYREKTLFFLGATALIMAGILLFACAVLGVTGGEQSSLWAQVLRYRATLGFEGTPPINPKDARLIASAYAVALRGILKAGLLAGASGIILLVAAGGKVRAAILGAFIVIITLADLWHFGAKYVVTSPIFTCYWPRAIAGFLREDPSRFRVLAPNIAVPGANQNMNDRIHSIGGYQTNNVGFFKEYVDFSQGLPSETTVAFSIERVKPMLEALGLKYLLLPEGMPFTREGYVKRLSAAGTTIYERTSPVPRAYVCRKSKVIPDKAAALEEIRRASPDPASCVVFEEPPGKKFATPARQGGRTDRVRIVHEAPGELSIEAELGEAGFLVLTDVFYPGWEVTIDGNPGRILRANHAFRAVALGEGTHNVRFHYRPRSFRSGVFISLASLLVFSVALAVLLRTGRRTRE